MKTTTINPALFERLQHIFTTDLYWNMADPINADDETTALFKKLQKGTEAANYYETEAIANEIASVYENRGFIRGYLLALELMNK